MPKLDSCEICGREAYKLVKRKVEGVIMNVCSDCQDLGEEPISIRKSHITQKEQQNRALNFGTIFAHEKNPSNASTGQISGYRPKRPNKDRDALVEWRVIENAPSVLQKIRNDNNLTPDQMAATFGIKENYLRHLEKGTMNIPIELARKIEKKFQVKLLEKEDMFDENEDLKQYMKVDKKLQPESMIYFRKRGQKPEYDQ